MTIQDYKDSLLISKADKYKLDFMAAGESLVQRTGQSITQLIEKATRDRIVLASKFITLAKQAANGTPPDYRSAVSRAYYAMYHIMRAVCYYHYRGDDHQEHAVLASKIPADFPEQVRWENDIKNARFERNRADYDPYAMSKLHFSKAAGLLINQANALLPIAKLYLRQKGCNL